MLEAGLDPRHGPGFGLVWIGKRIGLAPEPAAQAQPAPLSSSSIVNLKMRAQ